MTSPGRAGRALRIERAIRAAGRAGNRLLAGARVSVEVNDAADARELRAVLREMGAREGDAEGAAFVFADSVNEAAVVPSVPSAHAGAPLPVTRVGLDGTLASVRDGDAAGRIAWAAAGMPVTAALAEALRDRGKQPRIAVSLVLEPKTAAFVLALARSGCEVAVFASVSETDPAVAAELARGGEVRVFAPTSDMSGESAEMIAALDAQHAADALAWAPELLIDDGAHLVRLAHTEHPEALVALRGAAEETTSGVRPLREMAELGELRIPVIAVNDARTKTNFDNRIGTGQSCVFAIADVLEAGQPHYAGVNGSHWAIVGYGPVGEGTARFARALGARVTVVERDPVRALAALHDGYEADTLAAACAEADVVVSATGVWHTLSVADVAALRPGTVLAVAGGIDEELPLEALAAAGWETRYRADHIGEWIAPGAVAGPLMLANGGGVNYSASEGNPIEVMDLSFATQLAALLRLLEGELAPGLHLLSAAEERRVAEAALFAGGGNYEQGNSGRGTSGRGNFERGNFAARPGGAAQPWNVHRFRRQTSSLEET